MNTDLRIAQSVSPKPIDVVASKIGLQVKDLELYGTNKAKLSLDTLQRERTSKPGKLVLVTAMTPTPAGEGKTTVSIGLADGMRRLDLNAALALREPSLGPVFGIKGGAAGGGYSQVIPMEDINLHFTGDMHAITTANNLLCAMTDNHIQHGNTLNIDVNHVTVKRCLDMNDRQLRNIVCGLGKATDGVPREDGFDITAASEIMAVLCMSSDLKDLKRRLNQITIGYTKDQSPVLAKDIQAGGALAVLLRDAFKPNLVQTLEHTPVFMHGGPFANIAHGCNSIIATKTAMKLADYTITEAGFGADLGAEKFLDIKCRNADIWPHAVVIVATIRALKYHGGVKKEALDLPNTKAIQDGFSNLKKHIHNLQNVFGVNVVVAINKFADDTDEEIETLETLLRTMSIPFAVSTAWSDGGAGAVELANTVLNVLSDKSLPTRAYDYSEPVEQKINKVAQRIYGASSIEYSAAALKKIAFLEKQGYGNLPVCIAKTQYSFSDNPELLGAPSNYTFSIRDVQLNSGAGFIVVLTGEIMRMPGLPATPAATSITLDPSGTIEGLF